MVIHNESIKYMADVVIHLRDGMIRRAKALRLADGEYVNYAGITDGTKGSVRFLIETGKIENN